jgi:RNA polymerase sigma-70 factor (ECF subfamily)
MPARSSLSLAGAVEAHYTELKVFLARRVGSTSMAEDIIQELWLRVAGQQPGPQQDNAPDPAGADTMPAELREDIRNPRAYLYRVAANLAIDRLRQDRRRQEVVSAEPIPETVSDNQPLPDQVLAGRQAFQLLQAAIRDLPEKCRQVFLLYRGEGLTMQQIADRQGISVKTVEKHIAKAMLACRHRVRQAQEPPDM